MATLHVRNVPDDLYQSLRERAREQGRSINAETIELLRPALEPKRKLSISEMLDRAEELRRGHRPGPGSPTVVEMIREDRDR